MASILKLTAMDDGKPRYINMNLVIRVTPIEGGSLIDFHDQHMFQEVTEPADFIANLWAYGGSNI